MGKAGFQNSKGNVSATSSFTTDNCILRTDTASSPSSIQQSTHTVEDTGRTSLQTTVNTPTALRIIDELGFAVATFSTDRPNLSIAGTPVEAHFYRGFSLPGSSKKYISLKSDIVWNSGTHTGGAAAFQSRLSFTNAAVLSTVEATTANISAVWQSTGTASRLVGMDNSIIAGLNAATTTGLVSSIFCNKAEVGFTSATSPGSIGTAIGFCAFAPRNPSVTQTIASLTGFYIADQKATGVTASYAIDIANQSSGGYAIRSGTGYHQLGDSVTVKGTSTAIKSNLEVKGSQGHKVTTLNAATLTLDATHEIINVTYTATGTVAIALPSATSSWNATDGIGRTYTIKDGGANAGTFNITINRAGSDTIVTTVTGATSAVISANGGTARLTATGTTTWMLH